MCGETVAAIVALRLGDRGERGRALGRRTDVEMEALTPQAAQRRDDRQAAGGIVDERLRIAG
jgi:hypothetical protein